MYICLINDFFVIVGRKDVETSFSLQFTFEGVSFGLDVDEKERDVLDHSTNPATLNTYALEEDRRVDLL